MRSLAPFDTHRGRFQRGRGCAWRELADHRPEAAGDDIVDSLRSDPRADDFVDRRAPWLAELAIATDSIDAVLALADAPAPKTRGFIHGVDLVYDTIAELASRGIDDALRELDRRVEGPGAARALRALVSVRAPATSDQPGALAVRLGLADEGTVERALPHIDDATLKRLVTDTSRLRTWSDAPPRVASMQPLPTTRREAVGDLSGASLSELLRLPWSSAGGPLLHQCQRSDETMLADVLASSSHRPRVRRNAARILAARGSSAPLRLIDDFLARADWSVSTPALLRERIVLRTYLRYGPADVLHEAALRWRGGSHSGCVFACLVLKRAAQPSDREWLESVVIEGGTEVPPLACQAIARLGDARSIPVLTRAFQMLRSSAHRTDALEAMVACDPEVAATWARDALWDCEEGTRLVALDACPPPTGAEVLRSRCEALRDDPHQWSAVREAAARRLADPI